MSAHPRVHRESSPTTARGVSDSVRVGAGDLIFVSGAVARPPGGEIPESFEAEIDLCFEDLSRALSDANARFADVVKLNIYIVGLNAERFAAFRQARERWLDPEHSPASTVVGVSSLVEDRYTIEIEAVAAV